MTMDKTTDDKGWIYIYVNNPGKDESFAGFDDQELGIRFIPAFQDKESALMCSGHFMDPAASFEAQAIHKDDLNRYAADQNFLIFMLDKTGAILEKINPFPAAEKT
ncbi:hypothetical protein SAMN05216233_10495 [Desulfoluna spongiiphila]|uniref:Uncharacterized protein n=2 Tax=Desulfoluna spongiiphila TaxID=419481 RepID=A0A1G5DBT6_9BACT|nr:hypothetical protein SAMN05216233_10495 [Desulfoluna spongiiphila]